MNALVQAERSPIQNIVQGYQSFGHKKSFLAGEKSQAKAVQTCALLDFTNLARVGFRGLDSAAYLQRLGFILPEQPNRSVRQADGSEVVRLSHTEYLLLGSLTDYGQKITQIEQMWQLDQQLNYLLPRQDSHAWLQLTGIYLAPLMAKLCAVDLSAQAFRYGDVVQSTVARINAIIINASDCRTNRFHLLCDRTMVLYLWDVLLDAMQEFAGEVVGIEAIRSN